jgi:hypothetical protein
VGDDVHRLAPRRCHARTRYQRQAARTAR